MRIPIILSVLMAGILGAGAIVTGEQPKPDSLPTWEAAPDAVSNLAERVTIAAFSIQPPKDYEMFKPEGPPGSRIWGWKGPQRYDRTSPAFMVNILTPPAGQTNRPPLEAVLDHFLTGIKNHRVNWQCSAIESGKISNVLFLRAHWSGAEISHGEPLHGILYTAAIPPSFVILSSQDADKHYEKAIPRAEAAFFSFQIVPKDKRE